MDYEPGAMGCVEFLQQATLAVIAGMGPLPTDPSDEQLKAIVQNAATISMHLWNTLACVQIKKVASDGV